MVMKVYLGTSLLEYQISIVHGKMKAADKEFEMQRFVNSNYGGYNSYRSWCKCS